MASASASADETLDLSERIVSVFNSYDADGNGKITIEELKEVLQRLNPQVFDDGNCCRLLNVLDRNANGTIELTEFVNFVCNDRNEKADRDLCISKDVVRVRAEITEEETRIRREREEQQRRQREEAEARAAEARAEEARRQREEAERAAAEAELAAAEAKAEAERQRLLELKSRFPEVEQLRELCQASSFVENGLISYADLLKVFREGGLWSMPGKEFLGKYKGKELSRDWQYFLSAWARIRPDINIPFGPEGEDSLVSLEDKVEYDQLFDFFGQHWDSVFKEAFKKEQVKHPVHLKNFEAQLKAIQAKYNLSFPSEQEESKAKKEAWNHIKAFAQRDRMDLVQGVCPAALSWSEGGCGRAHSAWIVKKDGTFLRSTYTEYELPPIFHRVKGSITKVEYVPLQSEYDHRFEFILTVKGTAYSFDRIDGFKLEDEVEIEEKISGCFPHGGPVEAVDDLQSVQQAFWQQFRNAHQSDVQADERGGLLCLKDMFSPQFPLIEGSESLRLVQLARQREHEMRHCPYATAA